MTDMTKYPELERLQAVAPKSQAIGEFIDWLEGEKGIHLAEETEESGRLWPAHYHIEKLLAEFFEIDLNEVERERRALLDEYRKEQGL